MLTVMFLWNDELAARGGRGGGGGGAEGALGPVAAARVVAPDRVAEAVLAALLVATPEVSPPAAAAAVRHADSAADEVQVAGPEERRDPAHGHLRVPGPVAQPVREAAHDPARCATRHRQSTGYRHAAQSWHPTRNGNSPEHPTWQSSHRLTAQRLPGTPRTRQFPRPTAKPACHSARYGHRRATRRRGATRRGSTAWRW